MAARPRGVDRQDAAERGRAGRRRIERQPLVARAQGGLERIERDPRLDGGGEIAGLVLDDAREPPESHHKGAVPRRRAAGHLRPAAPREHRHARRRGRAHHAGHLVRRAGQDHAARRAAIHYVGRPIGAAQAVRGADDLGETPEQGSGHWGAARAGAS